MTRVHLGLLCSLEANYYKSQIDEYCGVNFGGLWAPTTPTVAAPPVIDSTVILGLIRGAEANLCKYCERTHSVDMTTQPSIIYGELSMGCSSPKRRP